MHNGDRIEVEQAEITRIHFLEHEDQRGKKTDVTQQAGNGEKTDTTFEFIEPGHDSRTVKERGRCSRWIDRRRNTDFQVCAPNRLLILFSSAGCKPAGRTG